MNYRSILQSDFNSLLVIFCILCAIFAVLIWFSVRSYKKIKLTNTGSGKKAKKKQKTSTRRDLIKWWIYVVLMSLLLIGLMVFLSIDILEIRYDIKNEAYATYEGECDIQIDRQYMYKGSRTVEYSFNFNNNGEIVTVFTDLGTLKELGLTEGQCDHIKIIYGERSKILLSVSKN